MAKQTWNNPIGKDTDWGGDSTTGGLPVSGEQVQKFIKDTLDKKAGVFYYDSANNRYLIFADEANRDKYLEDQTQVNLIIGAFDAPANYTAEITLSSPIYNAVFLNSTGNYIDFTFDIKNKQGVSTGENVNITYTFIRNATKKVVTELGRYGESARINVDKYLGEGTNTVIIGVTGQTTLAATTVSVTYQVINLSIEDTMDISKVYNLSSGSQTLDIPFKVSGYGTKVVEWYVDGVQQQYVKSEDEVVDTTGERTKRISISNLQQGKHSVQFRVYTLVNGERFETDTLYRDFLVYTGANANTMIGIAMTIPKSHGVLGPNDTVVLYDMTQYVPYNLRFATYTPTNAISTPVSVYLGGELMAVIGSANGVENVVKLVPTKSGASSILLDAADVSYTIPAEVKKSSTTLEEITNDLVLDFNANGKNNYSEDKDSWSFGGYKGTFTGFNWNETSGWVNGRLEMNPDSSLAIDYAPLVNPTQNGKTIEIEWSTKNVSNDNAVICDLRGENGVGILITATKVSLISADGVVVETEYKSEENVRIGFVINKPSGATNQRLSFIYANGILSRCEKWAAEDNYNSNKQILFTATSEASISLKSIRIYDTALSSDEMLNNYTLYRDTLDEMLEVYDRNNVYAEGTSTFSPEKMMNRLPVMIVTGDIPTLENTSDKDTQIVVDIEYHNLQNPSKSFTMTGAAMRPQGTSSMGYPKKNFRIYTQKVDGTALYDANGNVVENKLYAFTDKAQPVDCWCLKADYAESSGTHNTGIARLWNNALINAQVDGQYVCRTEAQKKAMEAGYEYDVRTTIDGFPILLFYRPSKNDDVIFIGKYNFNNDKSTESVFGFTGIPNFNNSRMQCWEVLNNGNALALFTSIDGFDKNWAEAFESRYPDTKTPYTGDLKAFCQWMVNVSQKDFATQKWQHLNVYMMAAYWVYLMRHAAADQFVKNAMFTSEDGQHFYYILYDNDTINGLINTGHLRIKPTDDRQTVDDSGAYVFAGHDSRLWNMLEADEEFRNIVSSVDNALYSAGISYANTIKIFDDEQADKWVEKVYNQDAQYKYIGPYNEKGIDNLFMLQGKRDLHRRWWLAKRFSIYDAKYVSGTYKSQAVELKCLNGTAAGQQFTVTAGAPLDYGFGINNVPREYGVALDSGESHTFTTAEVVNIGDPIRIYGAPNIQALDLSKMSSRLAVVTITNVFDKALGTKLTKLVVGGATNNELSEISGLKQATALEELDITNMTKIISLDLSDHSSFKTLKAFGSGLSSVTFAKGAPVESLQLPASMRTLSLEQLPYLYANGISFANIGSLTGITIKECPNVSNDFNFVYNWYTKKAVADASATLAMDRVNWQNVDAEKLMEISHIGNLNLKGVIRLKSVTLEQVTRLMEIFGETAFNENAELFITGPAAVFTIGNTQILEGSESQFKVVAFGGGVKSIQYTLYNGSNSYTSVTQNGLVKVNEGFGTGSFTLRVIATTTNETVYTDSVINVTQRTYPTNSNLSITGNNSIEHEYEEYFLSYPEDVNGDFMTEWSMSVNEEGYVAIDSYDDFACTLKRLQETYLPIYITLTAVVKKRYNGSTVASASKEIMYVNETVAETDAGIVAALYAAGLCASDKYISKDEAAQITASDLQKGTSESTSIFYNYSSQIKSFDGFKYFSGISSIPQNVFYGCMFESITLPEGVVSIEDRAFIRTTKLKHITLPKAIASIGKFAFAYSGIESIDLKEVVTLANDAFYYCDKLEEIVFPSTLSEISSNTCYGCSNLKNVVLKEGVTTIGSSAFCDCPSLEYVEIPASVTTIQSPDYNFRAKNNNGRLIFSVADANPSFRSIDGVLFDKDVTTLLVYRKSSITKDYIIPSSVTSVGKYAFYYSNSLTSVSHDGTLILNDSSFEYCENLTTADIIIEDFPINGGSLTFYGCKSLQNITLGPNVKSLPSQGFSSCVALKSIYSHAVTAPRILNNPFGHGNQFYTGRNTYNTGENFLYVPLNATGYKNSSWNDPLQNATKCGFTLYGELTISSNRTNAQFNVTYTTVDGPLKSMTVGVGTCYLNDVKYNTEMIITPLALEGGYIWQEESKTFDYEKNNNSTEFNAYIYPSSLDITGKNTIVGGISEEYTAVISPANIDIGVSYSWSLTPSNNASIIPNGQTCQINTNVVTGDENLTLTCTITSADGKMTITKQRNLTLQVKLTGVFIQHIDASLYTIEEWTANGFSNDEANGVAVLSLDADFVIAKEDVSTQELMWGGEGVAIEGLPLFSNSAIKDYDGFENTQKIVAQLSGINDGYVDGAPAAEACVAYTFPNGKNGYLPAQGELYLAYTNRELIGAAFTTIGGTPMSGNYWASTAASNTKAWTKHASWSNAFNYNRHDTWYVRACTTL